MTLWSDEDVRRLDSLSPPTLVVGREVCPKTGRVHFHAYVRFGAARSFQSLHLHFPNAHIEPRLGTEVQAIEYCKKDGVVVVNRVSDLVSDGALERRKQAGEVEAEVHRRLRAGETIRACWEDHPVYCARNMRMLRAIVRVYELWGHRDDGMSPDNLSGVEL